MNAEQLIADFRRMLDEKWGYIPGASGELWTAEKQEKKAAKDAQVAKYGAQWIGHHVADCSGAFVWAYRQHGLIIYHGSNRIARGYVASSTASGSPSPKGKAGLLPPSEAKPGMAAFKARAPGEQLYSLPAEYRPGGKYCDGDLNDYYHIGLVDSDPRYVINAQTVRTGVRRSKLADGWDTVAYLKDVDYKGEDQPMEAMYRAEVVAANGKPVNLRKGPSTASARVCAVPVGETVDVLNETDADWAEVRWGDKTGYMMRKFLRRLEENAPDARLQQLRELLAQALRLTDDMMGG